MRHGTGTSCTLPSGGFGGRQPPETLDSIHDGASLGPASMCHNAPVWTKILVLPPLLDIYLASVGTLLDAPWASRALLLHAYWASRDHGADVGYVADGTPYA